jgi:proline iminopeptidase
VDGYKTTQSYKIATPDGHHLYVEESGNSSGPPVLFLHGGPGAGIGQHYQGLFNTSQYRLIAFDQRGCGRSQPYGSIEVNTTQTLIADIELIRAFFNIDKWLLFGGSWGSTLALCYAIAFPEQVSAMILRGIFLGRKQDSEWFLSPNGGAAQVYPQQFKAFAHKPEHTSAEALCQDYFVRLSSSDESIRYDAATRWFNWEGSISKLILSTTDASELASIQQMYTLALMECYYVLNNCFIEEDYILKNASKIAHIPSHLVHGRYDMVCKSESAVTLHQHLPNSTLTIVADAGHSMNEPRTSKALMNSLNYFANRL